MLISQCHFDVALCRGPLKPKAVLKPMGPLMDPLKSMGPGVIAPPAPPLGGPGLTWL